MKYIMVTLQCGLKKRVTLLQYLKMVCIPCSGLLFSSVCAECADPNIDILIFPLGLETVSVSVSSFSFIVYTNCDVKSQTCMFTS